MEYLSSEKMGRMALDDELDKERGLLAKVQEKMEALYKELG